MKLEITEIPTETNTKPKAVGATLQIESFCDIQKIIETFMEENNLSHASFRIDGVVKEQVDYRFEEMAKLIGGKS